MSLYDLERAAKRRLRNLFGSDEDAGGQNLFNTPAPDANQPPPANLPQTEGAE